MNGGLAVIADLPKMMVYRVSRWRNQRGAAIPESTITKAPSAELRPDQTDQDSLPPYDLLDEILELHVEQCQSAEEIIAQGYDEQTVRRVLRLVRIAEFKRKQAAPVLKVTSRAFGTGLANADRHDRNRAMKISIIGLGKLGAPMAAVMAHKGHTVVGVDINPALREGDSGRPAAGQRTAAGGDDRGQP